MNLWTWLRAEWDRVAGIGFVLLGALFLLLGYQGVQDSPFLAEQLAYIASGGLGGIFCLGFGVGLLLSADLHDEWHKLDRIEAALRGEPLPDSTQLLEGMAGHGPLSDEPSPETAPDRARPLAVSMGWRADQLSRAVGITILIMVLPLTLAGVGWRRASQTSDLDVATRGLAFAVAGTVLALAVIAGYALWLRMRVVRREARLFGTYLLEHRLAESRRNRPARATVTPSPGAGADGTTRTVVTAPGLRRFHAAGCPALSGLEASIVDRAAVDPHMTGCGICGST